MLSNIQSDMCCAVLYSLYNVFVCFIALYIHLQIKIISAEKHTYNLSPTHLHKYSTLQHVFMCIYTKFYVNVYLEHQTILSFGHNANLLQLLHVFCQSDMYTIDEILRRVTYKTQ